MGDDFKKLATEGECKKWDAFASGNPGGKALVSFPTGEQILDDAAEHDAPPKNSGMTLASKIFHMALGGLIVAAAITAFNFIVAKRSQAREASGRSAVELPAAAIEA